MLTIVDGQAIPKSGSVSSGQPSVTIIDDHACNYTYVNYIPLTIPGGQQGFPPSPVIKGQPS